MMKMVNPPHPGEIIKGWWLDPMGVSITEAAQAMAISRIRQSIALKPAEESFRQGWQEALRGETLPVSELWTGIEA